MCLCACVRACASAGETVVGPSFMNGKRAFVISSPYLVTGFVQRGAFVYVAQNKMWLSRRRSSAPSVPNLLPIYNNYSRVCGLLLQISAHRCGAAVTACPAAWRCGWTHNRLFFIRIEHGAVLEELIPGLSITGGVRREAARQGQPCAWAGPHSSHHQEARRGPSPG